MWAVLVGSAMLFAAGAWTAEGAQQTKTNGEAAEWRILIVLTWVLWLLATVGVARVIFAGCA